MGYGNQPGNVVETALPGLGRLAAFVKGERIFTKNREQIFFARVETGLVYLCAENERYDRSILRFFRPGDWFSGDMLLQIPHGVSYLMAKYSTTLRVFSPEEMEDRLTMHRAYLAAEQAGLAYAYLLQQRTPRQRLLLFFAEEARRQEKTALHLPLPLVDLADYLAVDRAAMTRELGRMKKEGLVSGQRQDWTLLQK